jgi:hypothetical protein
VLFSLSLSFVYCLFQLNPGQEYTHQMVLCFQQTGLWQILANCQDLDCLTYYWCMQPPLLRVVAK